MSKSHGVDVLAWFDARIEQHGSPRPESIAAMFKRECEEARAAVAELIAADHAFDCAARHLRDANNKLLSGKYNDDDFVSKANCQHAYDRAVDARRAALAKLKDSP